MKTVVMSQKQAEWAGNAVAVAGGWIAVGCDRVHPEFVQDPCNQGECRTIPGGLLAYVPDGWTDFVREISVSDAVEHLRLSINSEEDAAVFAASLQPAQ